MEEGIARRSTDVCEFNKAAAAAPAELRPGSLGAPELFGKGADEVTERTDNMDEGSSQAESKAGAEPAAESGRPPLMQPIPEQVMAAATNAINDGKPQASQDRPEIADLFPVMHGESLSVFLEGRAAQAELEVEHTEAVTL